MKKKILVGCIIIAVFVILASLAPVIGTAVVKPNDKKNNNVTPLFTIRIQRFVKSKDIKEITANYLGKEKNLNLLFPIKAPFHGWINTAIELIKNKPNMLDTIFSELERKPEVINLLEAHNIDINDFKNDIAWIKNDPSLLKQKYEEVEKVLGDRLIPSDDPVGPLGLIDQWQPGLLLIILLLLPFLITIGVVVATILIITCLLPKCFEAVFEAVVVGLIQGLHQPDH